MSICGHWRTKVRGTVHSSEHVSHSDTHRNDRTLIMDYLTPTALPEVLDPVLTYLSELLPPPLYSFLLSVLSHCLALFTALISLSKTLLTSKPWEWDTQTILPPLITFLAAWLAIVSIWRTTTWMIRSSVWALKWGVIVGGLVALAGWATGSGQGGVTSSLMGLVLDLINGPGRDAAGGSRTRTRSRVPKPRVWDSFQAHRDWQYQENNVRGGSGNVEVQKIIGDIVSRVTQDGWWNVLSSSLVGEAAAPVDGGRMQSGRKAKTKKGRASHVR
jgi:hypothetical protein